MLPQTGELLAALLGGGIAAGLLLLIAGWRGVDVDPTRPAGRLTRIGERLRAAGTSRRLGAGGVVAVAVLVLTRWPVAAVGVGALVVSWPSLFGGARAEQVQIARLEALAIWTESLRDTIRAHAGLERAIPVSTQHAPPLIREPLVRLAGKIRVHTPLERALEALAADLDDPSADVVVAALILSTQRRGDQLAGILSDLVLTARQELDLRRKIAAGRAGIRKGVQIMVALTVGFAAYLTVFSRDYVRPYNSLPGQIALAVVIGLFAAGFAWMRALATGPRVQPFLGRPGLQISPADLAVVSALTGLSDTEANHLGTIQGPVIR